MPTIGARRQPDSKRRIGSGRKVRPEAAGNGRSKRDSVTTSKAASRAGVQSNHSISDVVLGSAACGSLLGIVCCRWHTAVESAQVLAGLVSYSPENPFFLYHAKTWTLLHQLPAGGLALGIPEGWMCLVLSALLGALMFVGVSLMVFALTSQRWLAVLTPLCMQAAKTYLESRGIYPLRMLAEPNWAIYGVAGAAWTIAAWSLVSLRRWKTGGLAMGLSLAVHPLLGAWCICMGLSGLLLTSRWNHVPFRHLARWIFVGAACSILSLAVQSYWTYGLPSIEAAEAARYISAFSESWDTHRQPFPFLSVHLLLALVALGTLTLIWGVDRSRAAIRASKDAAATEPSLTMAVILILSTVAALAGCLATHVPHSLPTVVMSCMPGRFINLTVLLFPAVVFAAATKLHSPWSMLQLAVLVIGCGLKALEAGDDRLLPFVWPVFVAAAVVCIVVPGLRLRFARQAESVATEGNPHTPAPNGECIPKLVYVAAFGTLAIASVWLSASLLGRKMTVLLIAFLWSWGSARRSNGLPFQIQPWEGAFRLLRRRGVVALARPSTRWSLCFALVVVWMLSAASATNTALLAMSDWRNDPFFAQVHRGKGTLATVGGMRLTQLLGRRPILLEVTSLNQLPYVPESGPEMNRVLRAVYGEDLMDGPRGGIRKAGIAPQAARELWEARDTAQWQELSREFGFGQVVAYADWQLQLPQVAKNRKFTLYQIPNSCGHNDD